MFLKFVCWFLGTDQLLSFVSALKQWLPFVNLQIQDESKGRTDNHGKMTKCGPPCGGIDFFPLKNSMASTLICEAAHST